MTETEQLVYQDNLKLVRWCVDQWLHAVAARRIMPGDLWTGPAGLLLAAHHGLAYSPDGWGPWCVGTEQHPSAYSWWSSAEDHAAHQRVLSHRVRQPLDELLTSLPLPLAVLVDAEHAFEKAAPSFLIDQNKTEVLFETETTGQRLLAALQVLAVHYHLDPIDWAALQASILDACV